MRAQKSALTAAITMAITLASGNAQASIEAKLERQWLQENHPKMLETDRVAYYVRYKKTNNRSATKASIKSALKAMKGKVHHELDDYDTVSITFPKGDDHEAMIKSLPDVEFFEPVPERRLMAQTVPWNIDQFQARDVWDKDRDGVVDSGAPDGSGVKFCIVDTGFYYDIDGPGPDLGHPDFVGVVADGVAQVPGEDWHFDGHGHGTHVAGTANAVNNDIGVVGVMPGAAELFIVKIFADDGEWSPGNSDLGAAALACKNAGANAISMSLGGSSSVTERNIFQDLYDDDNIILVAAAGNDGNDVQSYPAGYPSVISVGALDEGEVAAAFSQTPFPSNNGSYNDVNAHWDATELSGGGAQVLSTVPAPVGNVPIYQASVNGVDYAGGHITGSGFGSVSGEIISGGLCGPGTGNATWNNKVVLCERGDFNFADKVNEVNSNGGVAALIYNNAAGGFAGQCTGTCNNPLIPSLSLTQAQGQDLLASAIGDITQVDADDGSGCPSCVGGYDYYSGTSMATPGVAAGIAWAWDACGGPSGITNKQLRMLLRNSAKDLTGVQPFDSTPPPNGPGESEGDQIAYGAGYDRVTGWGLVQLKDALELGNQLYGSTCPLGLSVTPTEIEVCTMPGAPDADFSVTLDDSFTGTSNMTASGVPAGASGNYSINPVISPNDSTVFTVSSLAGLPTASHQISLLATDANDANNTASSQVTLNLVDNTPDTMNLVAPVDGASGVDTLPTLTWSAANQAVSYDVEVFDGGNLVESATGITGTSYTLSQSLNVNTTYTWRVTAVNACGGNASSTFSFTTSSTFCFNTATAIPDGDPTGITTTINVPSNGTISDLMVSTDVTHAYPGDLIFTLEHENSGVDITLMDRPGRPQSQWGCGNANIDTVFDDASGNIVETQCNGASPAIGPDSRPDQPLSDFDGLDMSGNWNLTISDNVTPDSGTINSWCLIPTLAVSNTAPVADDQNVNTNEDTAVGITLTASDVDGDPMTYSVGSPSNGVLSGTAPNLTYTPNSDFNGNDSFTFTVNDGTVDSNTATVTINVTAVNDAPTADSQNVNTSEDNAVAINLVSNDIDGDQLAYSVGSPANGVLSGTAPNLTYTPTADFNGNDSFTFTVNDGSVDSNVATVTINVSAVNDTPTADSQNVSTSEDTSVGITLTSSDVDGDQLIYSVGSPSNGVLSGVAPNLSYTPDAGYNGADSFTFTVNDGSVDSNVATVTINVGAVNDAPTADSQSVSTFEDTAVAVTLTGNDVDGDPLTYAVASGPSNGSLSGTAPNLTYTPASNFNGNDSFTFIVNDGTVDSSAATVTINVSAVNDAPTADSQSVSVNEDASVAVVLTGSDIDGDSLSYAVASGPSNGSLSGSAPNLTYTPDANFNGNDSFTFIVNDGTVDSSAATVTINVNAVNDVPTADSQSVSVNEDASVAVVLTGSDIDGDSLSYSVASGPSNGSLSGSAPNLTYTPDGNFNGNDSFTFIVNDGTVDSSAATVTINVNAVNDAPSALGQAVNTNEDNAVGITLMGNDPDGDSLSYSVASGPSSGSLSGSAPNLTYTPNGNFNGNDSFTFIVNDGTVDSSAATVDIIVQAENDAPTADSQSVSVNEDASVAVVLTGSDIDGDSLSYSVASGPSNGSLSGSAPNLTYTPNANFFGNDSFTFTVNDGTIDSSAAIVNVTVNPIEDPTVANGDSYTVLEDSNASSFDVTGNDTDADGDAINISTVGNASNGTTAQNGNMIDYTPNADFCGQDSFTYEVNGQASATVDVDVTCVNDQPSMTASEQVYVALSDIANPPAQTIACDFAFGPANESGQSVNDMVVSITDDSNNVLSSIDADNSGQLSYTFTGNAGVAEVTVAMQDDGGTANSGQDTSVAHTFYVNVHDYIFRDAFEKQACDL